MADLTSARPEIVEGLAGQDRVRVASSESVPYRTFSKRAPVFLTATGGFLLLLGGLGTALRASAVFHAGSDPVTVRDLMGFHSGAGWAIAAAGALLAASSLLWTVRSRVVAKIPAILLSVGAAVLVASRLVSLDDYAAIWATDAKSFHRYIGYHAGLGWGAWAMLGGAILDSFGLLIGVLRAIDLRRGFTS